ncbi:FGGY-family carbohydrate kinase [Acidiphilium sp.]|uniref:FGGY-family carbohydrate kinase n=1 Tax=Acidiphilium sp. TaxID=527 RepID=UPI003D01A0C1
MLTLGIDIGTSGIRAVAIDAAGTVQGWGRARIGAEERRDAMAIWRGVGEALAVLRPLIDMAAVRAIAVDGTSGTLIVTDAAGRPTGPATLYIDQATAASVARIAEMAPRDSAAHGKTSPLARLLDHAVPGSGQRALHEADWVTHLLGGPLGVSDANNALKTGYDPVAGAWPGWIGRLGLAVALPRVVEPGTVLGPISPSIAARFGFNPATWLVAGTTDGCASFLATGADQPGDGVTALGSTLTLKLVSDRPVFAPDYGVYSHRLAGHFLPGGASSAGAAVLARYFTPEQISAISRGIDPGQDSGLDYYPLPAPGERFPNNDATLEPRLGPRPVDDTLFLHGLLEGLARIEALGYRRLAALGAPRLRRVLTVGGGAVNPVWTALRARVIGVDVTAAAQTEAAYGSALLARRQSRDATKPSRL